jgi:hypothetical protein
MSFPSGDVAVTLFVGAHDNNNGTVVPPQGSEFLAVLVLEAVVVVALDVLDVYLCPFLVTNKNVLT